MHWQLTSPTGKSFFPSLAKGEKTQSAGRLSEGVLVEFYSLHPEPRP
jgi:hypothetical protein